ncbi:hypothetical protein [Oricola thermophila]|uniref:Chemotaxis protein n=1 Tax=Oricola thermophila TaxID=2742145 RepID=A0A6N1VF98_9HYPH|nr:hypothetical protein [Oricola thermophila]QKV19630.1 hypothetical protein HTY61_14805 [Oricola thermophila]
MMRPRHSANLLAAGFILMAFVAEAGTAVPNMEPHRLVRSLQRIQDEIADGDKAAVGMQLEMTRLVDQSFRRLGVDAFEDVRTATALISYSMLGGNPSTLEEHLADLGSEKSELAELGYAVLSYQKGASQEALVRLRAIDPYRYGGLFGASIALVRGLLTEDDLEAVADFDTARLLAPGTLIEEAALRRLMSIHRRDGNTEAFLRVASRYARRFVASPYALQYAQEFAAGVVALGDRMDMDKVLEILKFMPRPYREALTLRLMHTATIEGKPDIITRIDSLAPKSGSGERAEVTQEELADYSARQQFYSLIAGITSSNVREVAVELRKLDTNVLTDGDRNLLRAVLAVADAVTNPVQPLPEPESVKQPDHREGILYEAATQQVEPVLNDFEDFVGGMRSTLEAVDQLLEEIE